MGVRPGNILVAVRDPRNLYYLREVLWPHGYGPPGCGGHDRAAVPSRAHFRRQRRVEASQVFDHYEQELFTAAVAAAEKEGKPISLLVVPATDVFEAIMVTAQRLESTRVVCGLSNKLSAGRASQTHRRRLGALPEPRPRLTIEVHCPDGIATEYAVGPHTPRLRPQDLELMHKLWLDITADPKFAGAHHYHVVALALDELQRELNSPERAQLLAKLLDEMHGDQPKSN